MTSSDDSDSDYARNTRKRTRKSRPNIRLIYSQAELQGKRRRIASSEVEAIATPAVVDADMFNDSTTVAKPPDANDVTRHQVSFLTPALADRKDINLRLHRDVCQDEITYLISQIQSAQGQEVPAEVLIRKLALRNLRIQSKGGNARLDTTEAVSPLPIGKPASSAAVPPHVLEALLKICSTPYNHSFISRTHTGVVDKYNDGALGVDWRPTTPWMSLMEDIRAHYALLHSDRFHQPEQNAPIVYTQLQSWHLDQAHDLLSRVFWSGVQVSDSLDFFPERCTVVATYKRLVVGIAILSSPQETYITYLAVKAGWDQSHIATSMLYHLIKLNPHKDITLHVSANNPAMLLYNRFGFKAEEFIVGFYEDYLDPLSRASRNAFRLRLRQ
ncbi:hypothetical protein HGRIS_004061 [Hohenbuehelia grisea]|uniref:N-acetyltransferase domain-containing protein n=1 Tax=Hohenbuehelia grisea TaxID=104357 RepID=A0ABR3JHZ3_9AGAR